MGDKQTLAALNELYATERFSLANYLRYAKPCVAATVQCLAEAIRRVSDEQLEFANRVGALVIERRGHIEAGSFPLRFTAFNDLSLAYLAPRVMEDQERIVRRVSEIARQLRGDAPACDLVNEILGAERAHLDNLRELLDSPKSEPVTSPLTQGKVNGVAKTQRTMLRRLLNPIVRTDGATDAQYDSFSRLPDLRTRPANFRRASRQTSCVQPLQRRV